MKKLLLAFIFIFILLPSFSQKIIDRKIDNFSGIESISTSSVDFNITTACNLIKVGNDFIYSIAARVSDMYEVADMGELIFKFTNDQILTIYSRSYTCAKYYNYWLSNNFIEYYDLHPLYYLPTADLLLLQTHNIAKVRIVLKSGVIDFNIKPNTSKKLMKMFQLFDL